MNEELFSKTSKESNKVFMDNVNTLDYQKFEWDLIVKAIKFMNVKHSSQYRKSGEPYVNHLYAVANECVSMKLPFFVVISGLLHDVLEDTDTTEIELLTQFGKRVTSIVTAVTKSNSDILDIRESETKLKIFSKSIENPYVLIIKLIDRLHNVRTMDSLSEHKALRKAAETREFYIPLSYRIGMNELRSELEDACFKIENKSAYYELVKQINVKKAEREDILIIGEEKIYSSINSFQSDINFRLESRIKSLHSIYNTLQKKNKKLNDLTDLFAYRIITDSVYDCYSILGAIHSSFLSISSRFKDYISNPKDNNYQSIHTTLILESLGEVEVQIRTDEMDKVAKNGLASHYNYKNEGLDEIIRQDKKAFSVLNDVSRKDGHIEYDSMLQSLNKKRDDYIVVYSPKGEPFYLPKYSTVLDYAFYVHPEIGKKVISAHINNKEANIFYELKSGNNVELIISKTVSMVDRTWLAHTRTNLARQEIKKEINKKIHSAEVEKAKNIVEFEFKKNNITNFEKIINNETFKNVVGILRCLDNDDLFSQVFNKKISTEQIYIEYITLWNIKNGKFDFKDNQALNINTVGRIIEDSAITHKYFESELIFYASCCLPVYKDPIRGIIIKGMGSVIHHKECKYLKETVYEIDNKFKWRGVIGFRQQNWNFDVRAYVSIKIIEDNKLSLLNTVIENNNLFLKRMAVNLNRETNQYDIYLKLTMKNIAQLNDMFRELNANINVVKTKRLLEKINEKGMEKW